MRYNSARQTFGAKIELREKAWKPLNRAEMKFKSRTKLVIRDL